MMMMMMIIMLLMMMMVGCHDSDREKDFANTKKSFFEKATTKRQERTDKRTKKNEQTIVQRVVGRSFESANHRPSIATDGFGSLGH
jgi:hypothetical protein